MAYFWAITARKELKTYSIKILHSYMKSELLNPTVLSELWLQAQKLPFLHMHSKNVAKNVGPFAGN